jgi:hypothetical protein
MAEFDAAQLRRTLCDAQLPGVVYMLIWSELDEDSDAYRALSDALFDHDADEDPDEAPARDLSDPSVRRRVADCAAEYPAIQAAALRVLSLE